MLEPQLAPFARVPPVWTAGRHAPKPAPGMVWQVSLAPQLAADAQGSLQTVPPEDWMQSWLWHWLEDEQVPPFGVVPPVEPPAKQSPSDGAFEYARQVNPLGQLLLAVWHSCVQTPAVAVVG